MVILNNCHITLSIWDAPEYFSGIIDQIKANELGLVDDESIEDEISWAIKHPSMDGNTMFCDTFEQCMDEWFEGFNLPYKIVNGERESFEESNKRVKEYFKNDNYLRKKK